MITIKFTETVPATGKTRHSKPFKLKIPRYPNGRIRYQEILKSIKYELPSGRDRQRAFLQPTTSAEAAWNALCPTSTIGSLLMLQDPASTEQDRVKAIHRLEWIVDRRFQNPRLREAAEKIPRSILQQLRFDALLLAAGAGQREETRIGTQWVTNRSGKKIRVKPAALTLPDYCTHIVQQARKILGKLILQETGLDQQESSLPLDEKEAEAMLEEVTDERAGPLDALIADEQPATTSKLDALSSSLSKKQREFFQTLRSMVQHSPTLNFSKALDKTAKRMKISPANTRYMLNNIRRTAKKTS